MIEVRRFGEFWSWWYHGQLGGGGYDTSAHALRDAWIWAGPGVPALVFT